MGSYSSHTPHTHIRDSLYILDAQKYTHPSLNKQTYPQQRSIVRIKGPLWLFAFLMVS